MVGFDVGGIVAENKRGSGFHPHPVLGSHYRHHPAQSAANHLGAEHLRPMRSAARYWPASDYKSMWLSQLRIAKDTVAFGCICATIVAATLNHLATVRAVFGGGVSHVDEAIGPVADMLGAIDFFGTQHTIVGVACTGVVVQASLDGLATMGAILSRRFRDFHQAVHRVA